jgi:hypothetical protein
MALKRLKQIEYVAMIICGSTGQIECCNTIACGQGLQVMFS